MLTHTPESFTCLSASLSEKDDMSVAGLLADCSKLLKGTLRVYTTSSDSSGLSLDTPGWDDTYIYIKKKNNHINNVKKKKNSHQWLDESHYCKDKGDLVVLSLPSSPLSFSWVCLRCTGWPPHLRSWGLTSWTSTPPPRAPSSPSPGFSTGDPASTAIVIIIFFPIIIKHNKHSAHNNTLTACLENILYIITISQESLRLFQLPWLLIHNDHYYYY